MLSPLKQDFNLPFLSYYQETLRHVSVQKASTKAIFFLLKSPVNDEVFIHTVLPLTTASFPSPLRGALSQ